MLCSAPHQQIIFTKVDVNCSVLQIEYLRQNKATRKRVYKD